MPQTSPVADLAELINTLESAKAARAVKLANPIHISELTSLPSFVYEKLRNIVDYKEEDLLRKNAIRRFLKRKFFLPQFNLIPEAVAKELIREMILSRYLANDSFEEEKLIGLGSIIGKYFALFNEVRSRGCDVPRWREQIIGLAAVEADNYITPPYEKNGYTAFAAKLLRQTLDLSALVKSDDERNVQLILTIERVLNRADRDILNYYLLLHFEPVWFKSATHEAVDYLAPIIGGLLQRYNTIISSKLGQRLSPMVRRLLVPLVILRHVWRNHQGNLRDLMNNPARLETEVRENYQQFWQATRRRIRRKGFHAMAYIFITKILLAILIELPYEKIILGDINYIALGINLLFPPLLMLIITLLIKSPTAQNEEQITAAVKEMVYGGDRDFYRLQHLAVRKPRIVTKVFYALLYTLTMGISFSALVYVLWRFEFNLLSGALFFLFVSLVSFFGINLRQQARQLKVIRGRETISSFIVDFVAFPIVALGKWLSTTFDRYNFFVFLLDFLFEVPFKTLLRVIEDWFHFLKEKKEEML